MNFVIGFWQPKKKKDLDESIDVSSSNDESVIQVPVIAITSESPHLETMSTIEDVDEDEAFICELMAMYPNDEDIVVEDLEEVGSAETPTGAVYDVPEGEEATEDGVRLC